MKALWLRLAFLALTVSLIAACGGGGGDKGGGGGSGDTTLNQGTSTNPVDLGVISTTTKTHAGSVGWGPSGKSYYKFTIDSHATGTNTIALTQTSNDLWWNYYGVVTNWQGTPIATCDHHYFSAGDEICDVDIPVPGTYYLNVINDDATGGYFTLTITPPASPLYVFDFDNGTLQSWVRSGGTGTWWDVTNSAYHSPGYSLTDSPSGNSPNQADLIITSPTLSLTGADTTKPLTLKFYHKYEFQAGMDWGFVEVSVNGGLPKRVSDYFTGLQGTFVQYSIDLLTTPALAGEWTGDWNQQSVTITFHLQTDPDAITFSGWSIDDVKLTQTP